jgi:hypothetical protein
VRRVSKVELTINENIFCFDVAVSATSLVHESDGLDYLPNDQTTHLGGEAP